MLLICFNDIDGESREFEESMDNKFIFDGAIIIVGVSILLILTLVVRYFFIGEVLNDIFCFINFYCLLSNLCLKSLF